MVNFGFGNILLFDELIEIRVNFCKEESVTVSAILVGALAATAWLAPLL